MSTAGRVARRVVALPGTELAIRLVDRLLPADRGALTVLTLHRVGWPMATSGLPSLLSASPPEFEQHVAAMVDRFRPVSLDEVLAAREQPSRLPRRALLVTIDDAYTEAADIIWPRLRDARVPAVLFVPTAYPDTGRAFWWDELALAVEGTSVASVETEVGELPLIDAGSRRVAVRRLLTELKAMDHGAAMARVGEIIGALTAGHGAATEPPAVLGWDRLRRLAGEGLSIAAHSRTHPMLDRLPPERLDDEVAGSLGDVADRIGRAPAAFAYPSGQHNDDVVAAVRRAGIKAAFTTRPGVNHLARSDWTRLSRINVGLGSRPSLLQAQTFPARLRQLRPGSRATLAPPSLGGSATGPTTRGE